MVYDYMYMHIYTQIISFFLRKNIQNISIDDQNFMYIYLSIFAYILIFIYIYIFIYTNHPLFPNINAPAMIENIPLKNRIKYPERL
jgi:hypothetical protein